MTRKKPRTNEERMKSLQTKAETYERGYYKLLEKYRKMEDDYAILVSHNLIHQERAVKLQDENLALEIRLYEKLLDKKKLLLEW